MKYRVIQDEYIWSQIVDKMFDLSFRCYVVSLCHFFASIRRLVAPVSTFPCFDLPLNSSFRFAYLTALAWEWEKVEFSLELHEVVYSLGNMANLSRDEELKTYLRQSVQFIFNRLNEQFDESESEVSYLILLKTESLDNAILAFWLA